MLAHPFIKSISAALLKEHFVCYIHRALPQCHSQGKSIIYNKLLIHGDMYQQLFISSQKARIVTGTIVTRSDHTVHFTKNS